MISNQLLYTSQLKEVPKKIRNFKTRYAFNTGKITNFL